MAEDHVSPIDRKLQREMLLALRDHYPEAILSFRNVINEDANKVDANVAYLEEHGLCEARRSAALNGRVTYTGTKITARGLDFLADDGGLSAVLGVVTIKLHDDTVKDLIQARIAESNLPPLDKRRWLDALRGLPAETTKLVLLKLAEMGLADAPAALHAIGTFLGTL